MSWILGRKSLAFATCLAALGASAALCFVAMGLAIDVNQAGVRESLGWMGSIWPYLEIVAFVLGWVSLALGILGVVTLVRGAQLKLAATLVVAACGTVAFLALVPQRVAERYVLNATGVAERIRNGTTPPGALSENVAKQGHEVLAATKERCGPLSRVTSSPRHSLYVFGMHCGASGPLWIWVKYVRGIPEVTLSESTEHLPR